MTPQEAKDKVIEEVLKLYHQGYDGPFIGKNIEPLFSAITKLEQITINLKKEFKMDLKELLNNLKEQAIGIKTEADAEYFYKAVSSLRDVADARLKQLVQERMNQQSTKRSVDTFNEACGNMNEFVIGKHDKSRL